MFINQAVFFLCFVRNRVRPYLIYARRRNSNFLNIHVRITYRVNGTTRICIIIKDRVIFRSHFFQRVRNYRRRNHRRTNAIFSRQTIRRSQMIILIRGSFRNFTRLFTIIHRVTSVNILRVRRPITFTCTSFFRTSNSLFFTFCQSQSKSSIHPYVFFQDRNCFIFSP